ncbi:diguanylate cyclase (GGDEF) domain-containing protein [Allopseudospirillum japonicum]|uniref:diguanylate cyclase n=1 Tax=Allopseudospirillum japonicum TaxID=64971 RepID=A0A1H6SXB2_9GAMM|nr:ligand-binding sensor domain-containing diguanylate cyclase [Allopseudospirillum japonicum]SEI70454.1 diguanylate cyclase (GGDEF) domain-containing protein [Allopseudospirillum japonicum]
MRPTSLLTHLQCYLSLILLSFSAGLTAVASTQATDPQKIPLRDYFAETWSTRDGLPHNSINSMAQTPEGYLWFATWEGAARYNGHAFRIYTRGQETHLPDSGLRALVTDDEGRLWVAGSRGGMSSWYQDQWHPYPQAAGMINHLLWADEGDLWFAIEGMGVYQRPAASLHTNAQDQAVLKDLSAYYLVQDQAGDLWAATDEGLYQIDPVNRQSQAMSLRLGLPPGRVFTLQLLKTKNQLLIGHEQGLWQLDLHTLALKLVHPQLAQEAVTALMLDSHQHLWLGTLNHGLYRLGSPDWQVLEKLDASAGLPNNRILSLLEDQEGSIWIGTNGGLFRLRAAPFVSWTPRHGLAGYYVRTLLSHPQDQSVWIGSSTGLNRYSAQGALTTLALATESHQQTPLSVLSLAVSPQQYLWVGTYTQGLLKVVGEHLEPVLNRQTGLSSNEVRAILEDSQGRIWIGTASGLNLWYPQRQQVYTYTQAQGLPADFIIGLAEDEQGRIWIGTGEGVSYLTPQAHQETPAHLQQGLPGELTHLNLTPLDQAEYAFGFYQQPGFMWMTTDRGLIRYRYSDSHLALVARRHGLPVDKLFQVVADSQGGFWLTSNRGVLRIQQQEAHAIADGLSSRIQFEHYGESDGMLSAQANGGSNPAATVDHQGRVWIASARGAVKVQPQDLQEAGLYYPPVVLENLQIDGHTYPLVPTQKIKLPAGIQRLAITYAGLGYVMPHRIEYRTRLLGFSSDWIVRDHQALVEYTNLPPGDYRFEVQARYPYGQWDGPSTHLVFSIQPLVWERMEFKALMAGASLALVLGLMRWRTWHLKRNEQHLSALVDQKTYELQQQASVLARQANEDQLTGLANRRALDAWLAKTFYHAQQANRPLCLAILDIDHFKRINDTWSHLVGDQAICALAKILNTHLPTDCKVARWGGEEFTLILPERSLETAYAECEHLRKLIEGQNYSALAEGLQMTASFGLASREGALDYNKMLNHADQALYQAKAQGRNQVVIWQPEMSNTEADTSC